MARGRKAPWALAALAAVLAAGCGEMNGASASFPGTVVYDSPDGQFHFHYLSPPWIPIKVTGVQYSLFVILPLPPPSFTTLPDEADLPYSLRIEAVAMPADQAIAADAAALTPPVAASAILDVRAPDGARTGREMSWQEHAGLYHREALLDSRDGASSFRMRFSAQTDIASDAMVTQMIASFSPFPDAGQRADAGAAGAAIAAGGG